MAEAKHTPGPWEVCTTRPNDTWIEGGTIYSEPMGKRVADACWLNSECEANARLIAAAPEMLDSLCELYGLYGDKFGKEQAERARAAIAKATGGET